MVEGVGVHRLDDAEVVGDLRQVWEELGHFRAALSVTGEFELGAEQRGAGIDEGGAVALQEIRRRELAVPLGELGFVVEEFEVTGGACHEEINHAFCFSEIMGELGR